MKESTPLTLLTAIDFEIKARQQSHKKQFTGAQTMKQQRSQCATFVALILCHCLSRRIVCSASHTGDGDGDDDVAAHWAHSMA